LSGSWIGGGGGEGGGGGAGGWCGWCEGAASPPRSRAASGRWAEPKGAEQLGEQRRRRSSEVSHQESGGGGAWRGQIRQGSRGRGGAQRQAIRGAVEEEPKGVDPLREVL
jgi:hypothetical protein